VQRKILVVDDEVGILRALRRLFRKAGFEAVMAESGEEALALVRTLEFPVVVSDFRMPGMDGGTLLKRIVEIDPCSVGIVLSGFAELKQMLSAFNSGGVHRFVTKPWVDTDLLNEVNRAFDIAMIKRSNFEPDDGYALEPQLNPLTRVYPGHLVNRLNDAASEGSSIIYALEFAAPHVVLGLKKVDAKVGFTELISDISNRLPSEVEYCHWSGYTLILHLTDSDKTDAVETALTDLAGLKTAHNEQMLRWTKHDQPSLEATKRIVELLSSLSETDAERIEFQSSEWRSLLDKDASQALERALETQDFDIFYQPVATSAGELVALEALLRCSALDESTEISTVVRHLSLLGHSDQLTNMQFRLAFSSFANLNIDSSIKLVLNLSLKQLCSPNLWALLEQHLNDSGLELSKICIDVGESALRSQDPDCLANLARFRDCGIRITLDDQGSAHTYLNGEELTLATAVKLDKGFINQLLSHANQQEMLANLCERIVARGMSLSFEGVETKAQLSFLQERYDFSYQGNELSETLDVAALTRWLDARVI